MAIDQANNNFSFGVFYSYRILKYRYLNLTPGQTCSPRLVRVYQDEDLDYLLHF